MTPTYERNSIWATHCALTVKRRRLLHRTQYWDRMPQSVKRPVCELKERRNPDSIFCKETRFSMSTALIETGCLSRYRDQSASWRNGGTRSRFSAKKRDFPCPQLWLRRDASVGKETSLWAEGTEEPGLDFLQRNAIFLVHSSDWDGMSQSV